MTVVNPTYNVSASGSSKSSSALQLLNDTIELRSPDAQHIMATASFSSIIMIEVIPLNG